MPAIPPAPAAPPAPIPPAPPCADPLELLELLELLASVELLELLALLELVVVCPSPPHEQIEMIERNPMRATLVNSFIVNVLSPKRTMVKRFMRVKTELVCTVPYPSYPISEKRSFVRPGLLGTARFREQRPSRRGWSLRR
jgi:hypothetical protein